MIISKVIKHKDLSKLTWMKLGANAKVNTYHFRELGGRGPGNTGKCVCSSVIHCSDTNYKE